MSAFESEAVKQDQTSIEKATKTKFIELNAKTSCWSSRDELSNSLSQSVELGEDIRRHTQ